MIPLLRNIVRRRLVDPRVRGLDTDSTDRLDVHRDILGDKPMMRGVFEDFYRVCLDADRRHFQGSGMVIELGAGVVSFLRELEPRVRLTDLTPAPHLDFVLDAQNMNLPDESVRAMFGINCFHHFPEPTRFLDELRRVTVPGGGCVIIDPYYGPAAELVMSNLHYTEFFDKHQRDWTSTDREMGVMTGANQAMSFIVFVRDRMTFQARYPDLEIVEQRPLDNYLRHLFSGGLTVRQLLPDAFIPILRTAESVLSPLSRYLALMHVVVIRKRLRGPRA